MKNTTDKLQAGSRGGARMTVNRFTIIFLLPLETPRDIHALNAIGLIQGKEDDW